MFLKLVEPVVPAGIKLKPAASAGAPYVWRPSAARAGVSSREKEMKERSLRRHADQPWAAGSGTNGHRGSSIISRLGPAMPSRGRGRGRGRGGR